MGITATVISAVSAGAAVKNSVDQGKSAKAARKGAKNVFERQEFYNQMLMDLMKNPESIFKDPGFQQTFDRGTQAVERSAAARGFTGSGNAAIALQGFGQDFALDYLNNRERLLAGLSGANVASSPAQLLGTAGQLQDSSNDSLGDALASLGFSFSRFGSSSGASAGTPAGGFAQQAAAAGVS